MDPQFDAILSEKELAEWLATSCPTLQRQRSKGSGPPFIRLSARRVGYRKSAVEKWLDARTSTRIGSGSDSNQGDQVSSRALALGQRCKSRG
jgi:predicted DNA-binding transcriptional regulator AlpA